MNVSSCLKVSFTQSGKRVLTPGAMSGKVFCYLCKGNTMIFTENTADGMVSQFLDDIEPLMGAYPDPDCASEFVDECVTYLMRAKTLRSIAKEREGAKKALELAIVGLESKLTAEY